MRKTYTFKQYLEKRQSDKVVGEMIDSADDCIDELEMFDALQCVGFKGRLFTLTNKVKLVIYKLWLWVLRI